MKKQWRVRQPPDFSSQCSSKVVSFSNHTLILFEYYPNNKGAGLAGSNFFSLRQSMCDFETKCKNIHKIYTEEFLPDELIKDGLFQKLK